MEKIHFDLKINGHDLMVNSDYYKWLKKSHAEKELTDIHTVKTKQAYLNDLGFDLTKHFLTEKDVDRLGMIEGFFFKNEILPNLKSKLY